MERILAIDQSTSATKAALFNRQGNMICEAALTHKQHYPKPGLVEHDALEIYSNTIAVCRQVLDKTGPHGIEAIGISNQRETVLLWDDDLMPAGNAIVWQDNRAGNICSLFSQCDAAYVKARTGLPLSPLFSAAKAAWLLREQGGSADSRGGMRLGTIDSWLVSRLTGNHLTDVTNASRTQLMDLKTLQWDEGCLSLFGIPVVVLPEIRPSDSFFGSTDLEGLLPYKVPICAVTGDSHGAMFAQGCHEKGSAKTTYGTGSSVMLNTGEEIIQVENLSSTVGWSAQGKLCYALEGNISHAADTLSWLKGVGLLQDAPSSSGIADGFSDNGGVYLVPAFTGLGAPWWKAGARTLLCGVTMGTQPGHIVRAALEAIAYQVTDVLNAMANGSGIRPTRIMADGGPANNRFLMQFQADMARVIVDPALGGNLSLRGAAYLAGIGAGLMPDIETVQTLRKSAGAYDPAVNQETSERWYNGWHIALARALLES